MTETAYQFPPMSPDERRLPVVAVQHNRGTTHGVIAAGGPERGRLLGFVTLCGKQLADLSQWTERPELNGHFGCGNCLTAWEHRLARALLPVPVVRERKIMRHGDPAPYYIGRSTTFDCWYVCHVGFVVSHAASEREAEAIARGEQERYFDFGHNPPQRPPRYP